jgi:hypothetical protein
MKIKQNQTKPKTSAGGSAEVYMEVGEADPKQYKQTLRKHRTMKSSSPIILSAAVLATFSLPPALRAQAPAPAAQAPAQVALPDWVRHPEEIQNLTPEMAKLLLNRFRGGRLELSGLTTLDAVTAQMLAGFPYKYIGLSGLTTLDTETAKALAEFKGDELGLNRLTTLDAETAKALAKFKGDKGLYLNGLTTLDAETAKALAEYKGDCLILRGLTTLDAETAKALEKFKGKISR